MSERLLSVLQGLREEFLPLQEAMAACSETAQTYFIELGKLSPPDLAHSMRVGYTLGEGGRRAGFDPARVIMLSGAGLLHDIGKLDVPRHILYSPFPLSRDERMKIKIHPSSGYDRLKESDPLIARIIGRHHEYQPDGYPFNGVETDPEFEYYQRKLALYDQVDALLSPRAYKPRFSAEKTKNILLAQGFFSETEIDVALTIHEIFQ